MNAHQTPTFAELNAVLDQASRPSSAQSPITDAQLVGLQQRWTTRLSARLDQAIEEAWVPTPEAATQVWRRLAADQPVLRAVLDDGARRSRVLADAMSGEFRILALGAGLVGVDEPANRAVALGRELRATITGAPTLLNRVA